jgi:HlyD family secretion protein
MIKKILRIIFKHKIISGVLLVILAAGLYFVFKGNNSSEPMYVFASVQKGTIIASISGSGQVEASQQIDVKPKVSGTITYIGVKQGQEVRQWQALAYLDSKDAQRAVRDAEISLESAEISLEKLRRSQDTSVETATNNLSESYRDAYNKISDAFLELPNLIELDRGILYDDGGISSVCGDNICVYENLVRGNFRQEFKTITDRAEGDYLIAKNFYDPNFQTYRELRLDAAPEEIVNILKITKKTSELLGQAIKSEQNMLDYLVSDINDSAAKQGRKGQVPSQITAYQGSIGTALGNLNSIISNLENAYKSIESLKRSIEDYQLENPVDIKSQENAVSQKEATLQDAKDNLNNYAILAPFAGIVANSNVEYGDSVSQSTVIATMFTKQSVAKITLNEIDVAKIKVGQKVTITFDAIENLTITGQVLEVDSIGISSQGVVSYGVKIGFDTQDDRVKPSMTVSANIITDNKQNVLLIPNSAVKSANNSSYVQVPPEGSDSSKFAAGLSSSTGVALNGLPAQKTIETGLSNDSFTEVTNGLQEGDIIITRIITASSGTGSASQGNNLFPGGGARNTGGAGGFRTQTR